MFPVKTSTTEYKVWFRHENPPVNRRQWWDDPACRFTECVIYQGEETVAVGRAYCHTFDNFNKSSGRVLSFKRAVASLNPDPSELRVFDEAYNKFHKEKIPTLVEALTEAQRSIKMVEILRSV